MNFNSFSFLIFLPIVFLLYWCMPNKHWKNLVLLVASYVFYACFDWRFTILLLFISLTSYCIGQYINSIKDESGRSSKSVIANTINVIIGVITIGIFKYYNFFAESLIYTFGKIGITLDVPTLHLILPIGISFYVFQSMSYTIDIDRGIIKPENDIINYLTYISFFPKIVAGPIERASNMLPQLGTERNFEYSLAVDGMRQMLWGYLKKCVIADNCLKIVNTLWPQYDHLTAASLLFISIYYSIQIYCDFSGYSDIAIGCGKLFGIRMMQNFNYPYFSRNIREFWQRWHITLGTWFRDYIYFPLGGSRCSKSRSFLNILVVFSISGLWHGANWTYVVWGIYHAILFLPLMIFKSQKYKGICGEGKILPTCKEMGKIFLTLLLVLFGWIIFRADSLSQALHFIGNMFDLSIFNISKTMTELKGTGVNITSTTFFSALIFFIEWFQRDKKYGLEIMPSSMIVKYRWLRWSIYLLAAYVILSFAGTESAFIYVQF